MSRILFDTNVLLDIATADAVWLDWSEEMGPGLDVLHVWQRLFYA